VTNDTFSNLIVYVDESGDHGPVSPEFPVFVLASPHKGSFVHYHRLMESSNLIYLGLGLAIVIWLGVRLLRHPQAEEPLPTEIEPPPGPYPQGTYDLEPRIRSLEAASRYKWKVQIVYRLSDGSFKDADCGYVYIPPPSERRGKLLNIKITSSAGAQVPLSAVRDLIVDAASESAKKRYSIFG